MSQTLEQYLRDELANCGAIDFSIRATVTDKAVTFYIHPSNRAGTTIDFKVNGNTLVPGDMCGARVIGAGGPRLGEDGAMLGEVIGTAAGLGAEVAL